MSPTQEPNELNEDQKVNAEAERACGERISYALERFGCSMVPIIELRAGQVSARIDIVKIPPEMLKQLKKARKNGEFPGPATASA